MSNNLGINSTTLIGKEEIKKLNLMLDQLFKDKNSTEFQTPVDY